MPEPPKKINVTMSDEPGVSAAEPVTPVSVVSPELSPHPLLTPNLSAGTNNEQLDSAMAQALNAIEISEDGKLSNVEPPKPLAALPVSAAETGGIPKFGALQPKVDSHPLFSGANEPAAPVRKSKLLKRVLVPSLSLLIVAGTLFLAVDAGAIRGASHLPFHIFRQPTLATKTPVITHPPAAATTTDLSTYQDKQLGYKFTYPKEYGSFTAQTPSSPSLQNYLVSEIPKTNSIKGVSGSFLIENYKTTNPEISSRKYGPTIKLTNGSWVVTQANAADPSKYKDGDTYKDVTSNLNSGLNVYTFQSSNEGGLVYRLVFAGKTALSVLSFPEFNSGQGAGSTATQPNNQTPYDSLYKQVRDSISQLP